MNLFKKKTINPELIVDKLFEAFTEDELRVLKSCENSDFRFALIREIYKTGLSFKFKTIEEAVPKARSIIKAANFYCASPISEEELIFYCKCLKNTLFNV